MRHRAVALRVLQLRQRDARIVVDIGRADQPPCAIEERAVGCVQRVRDSREFAAGVSELPRSLQRIRQRGEFVVTGDRFLTALRGIGA